MGEFLHNLTQRLWAITLAPDEEEVGGSDDDGGEEIDDEEDEEGEEDLEDGAPVGVARQLFEGDEGEDEEERLDHQR